MCRFITIVAPLACQARAAAILKNHRGWVSETRNKDLAKLMTERTIQLISSKAGCDCSTVFDNDWAQYHSVFEPEKLAEKWRRKGWSEAKIERSLADKEHGKATTTHRGPSDTFELWEAVIREMLEECSSMGEVGLFLHEYNGGIDVEPMKPTRRRVSAKLSLIDALRSIKEDELMLFDRAWQRAQEIIQ